MNINKDFTGFINFVRDQIGSVVFVLDSEINYWRIYINFRFCWFLFLFFFHYCFFFFFFSSLLLLILSRRRSLIFGLGTRSILLRSWFLFLNFLYLIFFQFIWSDNRNFKLICSRFSIQSFSVSGLNNELGFFTTDIVFQNYSWTIGDAVYSASVQIVLIISRDNCIISIIYWNDDLYFFGSKLFERRCFTC